MLSRPVPFFKLGLLATLLATGSVSGWTQQAYGQVSGTTQTVNSSQIPASPTNTNIGMMPQYGNSPNNSPSLHGAVRRTGNDGIYIPAPPTPAAIGTGGVATSTSTAQAVGPNGVMLPSNNPTDLATQAEQAALQAQADADAAQARRELEHNIKSFDKAETGIMPLSNDQIRAFMHRLEQTQESAQNPYAGPPKPQVRISTLSLDPGAEPPQVNLNPGYVTTINMLDATGAPWPIMDVGVGGSFEVSPTPAGTHVVRIMPLTRVGMGDLSVLLKDLPTPVIFRLSSGGSSIDMRYDARIPKFGPNAKQPLVEHQHLVAGDELMMLLLENVPPKDAQRLKVAGLDARTLAWKINDKTYLRSSLQLLSPAWNASVSSADGMTVYEIGDAPVLLMSDNGAVVRARVSRGDDDK